jgi:hypothetical protein
VIRSQIFVKLFYRGKMRTLNLVIILSLGSVACVGADMGRLKLEVDPGRAGVFIDGKYVGPAANFKMSRTYDVLPGEHEVKLSDPRYEEKTTKVMITSGKKTVLHETLTRLPEPKPPFGKVHFENPDHFAAVYVNGRYMGHVDEFGNFAQSLLLNPGTYEMKIVPVNGQNEVTKTVTVEANKTITVQ